MIFFFLLRTCAALHVDANRTAKRRAKIKVNCGTNVLGFFFAVSIIQSKLQQNLEYTDQSESEDTTGEGGKSIGPWLGSASVETAGGH